ncbi:MarR family winged helix-turn-helix transcriptional regulator [Agromyces allii]|uniref:HTH marR-type domain-containing protein n=1 Tax=Agromyces allii TaxID=393607 RepID=A0ABP5CFH8_9MICO|nr:MarR family winged helix-turn-helix transcriptional regulator [Agromyces allii]
MDAVDLPDEQAQLWYLIRRVAGLLDRTGDALFRRELDISLAQFLVLSVVDAHPGPLNQQAIADRLGLTKGTVSRQIEQAVAAGLMTAETSAHNRREKALGLTAAGTDLVRRGDALYAEARTTTLPTGDADDVHAALRVLEQMNRALG